MVIAANYTLHIYCDCQKCKDEYWNAARGEYIGETWTDVARQARADGWYISRDRCVAYAYGHKRIR